MANAPPFMNSTGLVEKIFAKIAEAQQPPRFTQDYLATKLGFGSGSARPIIPLLKRLGFLRSDGTPTELYSRFRNPSERGAAVAEAIRHGYADVYERNEYAHELARDKFRDLIVQMTGLEKNNSVVKAVVGTFYALKSIADFDAAENKPKRLRSGEPEVDLPEINAPAYRQSPNGQIASEQEVGLNLSYTINLNLPETTNIEVFNAIFRSIRENLLRK